MTAYRRGGYYEAKTADLFTAEGYVVWLARGSKGAADLLALKPGQVVLVQVKSGHTGGTMGHEGWNGLLGLARDLKALPVVVQWQPRHPPTLRKITGPHTSGSRYWPCVDFVLDELGALKALSTKASLNTNAARGRSRLRGGSSHD